MTEVEVFLAMSDEQAKAENTVVCYERIGSWFLYFDMMKLLKDYIDEGVVQCIDDGWHKEVAFSKKDAQKVFDCLYPEGIPFDYKKSLERIKGDTVRLIGFGD